MSVRAEEALADYYNQWIDRWDEELYTYRVPLPDALVWGRITQFYEGRDVSLPPYLLAMAENGTKRRSFRSWDVDPKLYGAGLRLALVAADGQFLRSGRPDYEQEDAIDIPAEWVLPFIDALVRMRPKLEELFNDAGRED